MSLTTAFNFNNHFQKQLPFAVSEVATSPFTNNNHLVAFSSDAAALLSLSQTDAEHPDFVKIFGGALLPNGACYSSQVYAGHQFGHFVPQLGDGRSISLGINRNQQGQEFDIQLKGSGPTPYSRMGDGRAVLRSTIREFLASEAFAALNIPTTRALCIIASDDPVYREKAEPGAIMTRLTPSNIRFGHYEYYFHHNKLTELDALANYCLEYYFPQCQQAEKPHLAMLKEITTSTAKLIAKWQAVGFSHGVMNTDNMSILGLTIDYGPFSFLDRYQPGFICNHSDHQGRYAFDQQPSIGLWNLNALAYTFSRWLNADDIRSVLSQYETILVQHYNHLMQAKLGVVQWQKQDNTLLGQFLAIMESDQADYHLSFRLLNLINGDDNNNENCHALIALFNEPTAITAWLHQYRARLQQQTLSDQARHEKQNAVNPKYILRNYLAETAIRSAMAGDYSKIATLQKILSQPYHEQPQFDAYSFSVPSWAEKLEVSCSS